MTKISYDQGTFSYALMLGFGAFSVHVANATVKNDFLDHRSKSMACCAYVLNNNENATYVDNGNHVGDPYIRFLMTRKNPLNLPSSNFVDNFPPPKTTLGRKLLEYRRAALAKGMRTLSVDEIDAMVNEGRGSYA